MPDWFITNIVDEPPICGPKLPPSILIPALLYLKNLVLTRLRRAKGYRFFRNSLGFLPLRSDSSHSTRETISFFDASPTIRNSTPPSGLRTTVPGTTPASPNSDSVALVPPVKTGSVIFFLSTNFGIFLWVAKSSRETARNAAFPVAAYSPATLLNIGISSRHGRHHEAQKFSTTTFPRYSSSEWFWPDRSVNLSETCATDCASLRNGETHAIKNQIAAAETRRAATFVLALS